jgi:hypothetical protein
MSTSTMTDLGVSGALTKTTGLPTDQQSGLDDSGLPKQTIGQQITQPFEQDILEGKPLGKDESTLESDILTDEARALGLRQLRDVSDDIARAKRDIASWMANNFSGNVAQFTNAESIDGVREGKDRPSLVREKLQIASMRLQGLSDAEKFFTDLQRNASTLAKRGGKDAWDKAMAGTKVFKDITGGVKDLVSAGTSIFGAATGTGGGGGEGGSGGVPPPAEGNTEDRVDAKTTAKVKATHAETIKKFEQEY